MACALLYGANCLIPPGNAFLDGYFNDILAGCLILAIVNLMLSFGRLKPLKSLLPCLALNLACGLVWEFVTPLYLSGSVSDLWDIAAYMIGGLIWCIIVDIAKRKC